MSNPAVNPTTSGVAFRVSILGLEQVEAYANVYAALDPEHDVVHVFSSDRQTHYLTIPITRTLIEWKDPSGLQPQLRLPPLGAGAFEQLGEQMQRMMEGMAHGMGQG
jgi:hypothetical protein